MQAVQHPTAQFGSFGNKIRHVCEESVDAIGDGVIAECGDLDKRFGELGLFSRLLQQVARLTPVHVVSQ